MVRLGVLGAGLLGDAMAKTWLARTGEAPLVWSRRWGGDWSQILEARSIVVAISGPALLHLVEGNEAAQQFTGNVFSAAASLSQQSLQRAFPRATVVCIAPFLIDGVNSIPMLVLRPTAQWDEAGAELETFGELDVVEDEEIFAQVSLLGAPFPAVVLAAVQAAADAGVKDLQDPAAIEIGKQIFYRAIRSLLANRGPEHQSQTEIATPGGITERGLKSLGDVTSLFESVFKRMRERAEEFRV